MRAPFIRRAAPLVRAIPIALAAALATAAGLGCTPEADLSGGLAVSGALDGNDLDQTMLFAEYAIDVGDLQGALAATKGGPRVLVDTNRRYDVWTLRVRAEERLVLRAASTVLDPVLAVADLEGRVLGVNDDTNPDVPDLTDATLVVDNPLGTPALLLVVVTEFGAPIGGGYLLEVNVE